MLDSCIQNFFPSFNLKIYIGLGEGELQENFEKDAQFSLIPKMTEKYEYCGTVPRTFVQDCKCV